MVGLHLALDKNLKMIIKTGVAPTSDISSLIGNARMNFPFIGVGKSFKVDLLPKEPEGVDIGTGFVPFFNHVGEGEPVFPPWASVKDVIADVFNTSCKPIVKYKYSTWLDEVTKGAWDIHEPSFYWPIRIDGTSQIAEDKEGRLNYLVFY